MTFDARSRERLAALGRTLPQKLPPPQPRSQDLPPDSPKRPREGAGGTGRHRLEKEEDPAELFRALMQASPDGTVPPHLLERLREVEGANRDNRDNQENRNTTGARAQPPARATGRRSAAPERDDLYTAFAQLLLEDGEDGDGTPQRRSP